MSHFNFSESRESSAEEIAKLSHAIDNRSHIACICEKDRITLGGFHVNMLYNQREYGYFSERIANPLKVRIKGPGNIEVSCTGVALVFRGGHISEESPHIACICEKDRITLGGFHVNMLYNQREYGYFSERIANPLREVS